MKVPGVPLKQGMNPPAQTTGRLSLNFARMGTRWFSLIVFLFAAGLHAQEKSRDLFDLSVEDLMKITVTSVGKKEERLSETAAAVYVITQDQIQRSGVTSIPEALRLAPGLQVAAVDAHTWAVSARGFNDTFANKLLVMMDGRSIYTPLFSGVFWDVQDTLLEDVDRIEVIRGPGASVWGANAVNGVINIITKSARHTQGLLMMGGAGTEERGFGGVRYGGQLGENAFYRAYVKYFNRDDSVMPNGDDGGDSWFMTRGGFRVDWDLSEQNLLTFQGDVYSGELDQIFMAVNPGPPATEQTVSDTVQVEGGNVLSRFTHQFSEQADLQFQLYYDRTTRRSVVFKEDRDTIDFDFQNRFELGRRQEVVWGLGYRLTLDDVGNTPTVALVPPERSLQLFSAFVQDEVSIIEDRLRLTLGSKFEHNDFTGFEFQPGGRLFWAPHERHTLWASVARAVRTPSRAEHDVVVQRALAPGAVARLRGDSRFDSESLVAYELGYRIQPVPRVTLDLAVFYNDYDDLRSLEFEPPPPGLVASQFAANELTGETYGVEAAAKWQMTEWWRLGLSYTYLQMQLHRRSGSTDTVSELAEGQSPHHQLTLRSSMDLAEHWELDWAIRYVDNLPALNIPSYLVLDARIAWKPRPNLEISLVGQNLLDDRHPEFAPTTIRTPAREVQHSVYGKVTWRF